MVACCSPKGGIGRAGFPHAPRLLTCGPWQLCAEGALVVWTAANRAGERSGAGVRVLGLAEGLVFLLEATSSRGPRAWATVPQIGQGGQESGVMDLGIPCACRLFREIQGCGSSTLLESLSAFLVPPSKR